MILKLDELLKLEIKQHDDIKQEILSNDEQISKFNFEVNQKIIEKNIEMF